MVAAEPRGITRRRALAVIAATAGWLAGGNAAAGRLRPVEWRGFALGTEARIVLYHPDETEAAAVLEAVAAEIERLEREFSLFRSDSSLSRLNRQGSLAQPSLDMRHLLTAALALGDRTNGAFDITVQPLWELYARHFASWPEDSSGPSADDIRAALARVNYHRVAVSASRIDLAPGAAVTLNGIAQGYITDRVADLLIRRGLTDVLVDLGELRGLGFPAGGGPWRAVIADPRRLGRTIARVPVSGRAVATSAGLGTIFDRQGRFHHLFDPKSGRCCRRWLSVSVAAARATIADAVSTALAATPAEAVPATLARCGASEAWLVDAGGGLRRVTAG
jgi:thiamine biosynthesis lipoprotein